MPPESDLHEDDPGAGTPTPESVAVGDPGTPSGDPSEAIGDDRTAQLERENAELRSKHDKALAEKSALEVAHARIQELESQTQRDHRPGTEPDPRRQQLSELQETMGALAQIANDPNDARHHLARGNLITLQAVDRKLREDYERDAIAALPPEYQAKTKTYFHDNRGRYADPESAYWALRGIESQQKSEVATKDGAREEQIERRHQAAAAMPASVPDAASGNAILRMKRDRYFDLLDKGRTDLIAMKDAGRLILTD